MAAERGPSTTPARTMRAVRLHPPGDVAALRLDEVAIPDPGSGDALVAVHAAGITRDELGWRADRLPAIPSYELSGTVAAVGPGVTDVVAGEPIYALADFDRDGAAAEYTAVAARFLAPRPRALDDVRSAAVPLAGLSAWQGLFVHGGLEAGQRVLIHGAAGGVGHLAVQLARHRGAYVIGTATGDGVEAARELGADEVVDRSVTDFVDETGQVDLVFDTVGGDALQRSPAVLRPGGRLVSVAEEPPAPEPAAAGAAEPRAQEQPPGPEQPPSGSSATYRAIYFVVEPDREQLVELARLADAGVIRPAVDSTFPLDAAIQAFERVMAPAKRGKVVLRISE